MKYYRWYKLFFWFAPFLLIIISTGCRKFIELEAPVTSVNQENAFKSNATATSVLTNLYKTMSFGGSSSQIFTGIGSISLMCGLSADEWQLGESVSEQRLLMFYQNALNANFPQSNQQGHEFWGPLYKMIYDINAAIEGLSQSTTITEAVKKQLLGEALFARAFSYFYLVNLYGDVPLILSTDYSVNSRMARSGASLVYKQIVSDLKAALDLLGSEYLNGVLQPYNGVAEKVRPTKWAAITLLSRTYLYIGEWANAEAEASKVINSSNFSLSTLNDAFLKNNSEAIWQIQPVNNFYNTADAMVFVIPSTGFSNSNPIALSTDLLNSFEAGDKRAIIGNWVNTITLSSVNYKYPFKYKVSLPNTNINSTTSSSNMTEYLMVFRLAELYLIRSEARARLGNIAGAQSDLNIIRQRAGLAPTIANDMNSLLSAILQERRVELFSEWGHRWFDLKRIGSIDAVMTSASISKGGSWQAYKALYPVPTDDIFKNSNLVQNPGY